MRDRSVLWSLAAIVVILSSIIPGYAQQTGFPPFGSFQTGGFDGINLQDLNVNFSIPVVTSPGRQMPFRLPIVYDSLIWLKGSGWYPLTDANGNPTWGWKLDFPSGQIAYTTVTVRFKCYNPGPGWFWATKTNYKDYTYRDFGGTMHWFPNSVWDDPDCWGTTTGTLSGNAYDPSGYYLDTTTPTSPVVTNPGGLKSPTASTVVDTNGNYLTQTINGNETDYTDTVGRTAAKVKTNTTNIQYLFLDGSGMNTYQTATLVLTSTAIKTNFACGVGEYSGTANLPTELDIPVPNSSTPLKYLFTYEPTPQNSGYFTGRLQKVTLPTGGTYEYDYGSTNDGVSCTDGSVVSMTRKVSDGTTTGTWQYGSVNSVTAVTDAAGNDSVYTFNASAKETQRQMYSGTGGSRTIQRTINSTWAANGTPGTQVTILEDNSTQSETDTTFDSNGLFDSVTEYDWGAGAHGPALRTTTLTFLNSTPYTTRNIINRVTTKTIADGSGTIKYREDVGYDEATITTCPTGVVQHDDTNYGCSMNYRGNPTSITVYKVPVTPAQGVKTNLVYDVFGNAIQESVSGTQQSQLNFSSVTKYALPDSSVNGPSPGTQLTQGLTYKADTGAVATSKDPNNQTTSFAYDFLQRITSVTRPDNSQVTAGYNDTNHTVAVTIPIDSSRSVQQITTLDALGRPLTTTVEDGSNNIYSIVQTNYDAMGRAYKTSNPYTGSPSYWTTTTFDALSRPKQVQLPDTSSTTYSYATNTTTVTDPAGKKRESVLDAAGRQVKVFEPDVTNGNTLTVETDYTYTVLDALATVTQGAQTRTYVYDALGRATSVTTPEASQVQTQYSDFNVVTQRTDARGVVTSYAHDTLNRLVGISYPTVPSGVSPMPNTICNPVSGTANSNVCLYYDQGGQSAYAMGQLTEMIDPSGSETYTYNKLGQTTQDAKVIGSTTYTKQYAYNTGGELTQINYPSTHVVYQSYDAIGRLCEVAGSTISTACGTTTTPYVNGFGYNVASQLTGLTYGNGVAATVGYSANRLQVSSLSYAKSGTTLFGLTYSYGVSGSNNGQISGITDSVDNGRSATYVYDALARISTAGTTGSTGYPQWGLSFTYDRYGNRTAETKTAGSPPSNSVAVSTATNQITTSGYAYDLSGNMTNDGYNTLVYDGESRDTSATNGSASATYTYDANGSRVKKAVQSGTTTVYMFSGSKVIAEYENGAAPALPTREYIYLGTALVAKIEGSSTVYYHPDQLSVRVTTNSSGTLAGQQGHYPFGETWYTQNTTTKWELTSYERDAESGNDYAMARYNVNRLGRFNSPDPIGGSSNDPQSLNRHAYVENDPIDLADPTGLCPPWGPYTPKWQPPWALAAGKTIARCADTTWHLGFGWSIYGLVDNVLSYDEDRGYYWATQILLIPGDSGGGNRDTGGSSQARQAAIDAAIKKCQNNGQLAFNFPGTKIPVTIAASGTLAVVSVSTTGDFSFVFPPSFGISIDTTVNAPKDPLGAWGVGMGKNLSVGGSFNKEGHSQGFNLSLGPSVGAEAFASANLGNVCGITH